MKSTGRVVLTTLCEWPSQAFGSSGAGAGPAAGQDNPEETPIPAKIPFGWPWRKPLLALLGQIGGWCTCLSPPSLFG